MEIKNVDRLVKKFNSMGNLRIDNAMKMAVAMVQSSSKDLSPVDTGRLKGSISSRRYSTDNEIVGEVFTNVHYGLYLEMGTYKMTAQPFLRPALKDNESSIRELFKEDVISSNRRGAGK